ncbi:MAG: hypothetical protein AB9834_10865 [Lentimicrobium sp.]
MISIIKSRIGRFLVNNLGWKTIRKIIVIECDDWGGTAIPDISTYNKLLGKGIKVDSNPYLKFDSLASEEDLQMLFEILMKYKDMNGRPPIITANTNIANPDFQKIREHNFEQYFYEPFTQTLKRYPNRSNAFDLWKEGISNNIFEPQFHGREHLNPTLWLSQLRLGKHKDLLTAFDYDIYSLPSSSYPNEKWILNSAFYPNNWEEYQAIFEAIDSGIDLFTDIFNLPPSSFIATGYFWNRNIEKALADKGITSIQGLPIQREPDFKLQKYKKTFNYTGKCNEHNQVYLVRNVFFEPTVNPGIDVVSDCLKRIEQSFNNNKPAIIGTHRLNFIGSLHADNRSKSLVLLQELLDKIIIKWPEVNFMSSSQLSKLIHYESNLN